MGYKEDIRIDIDHLDAEWIKQAALYQYYAKKEAIALYERDQLADKLALTQAQLDGDIRCSPEKFGIIGKPTEAAILNTIKQQPTYTEANNLVMKAACKAKIIGGAVRAFDHKKKALEKLTDLYLSGYWAAPKIKSEAQEVYGKQTRVDLEASLKREDRLIAASLKREADKAARVKAGTNGEGVTAAGVKSEAVAAKKKAATAKKEIDPDAARAKIKAKSEALAKAKKAKAKAKAKTRTETKPIGKTRKELSKQDTSALSSKPLRKKKK